MPIFIKVVIEEITHNILLRDVPVYIDMHEHISYSIFLSLYVCMHVCVCVCVWPGGLGVRPFKDNF